MHASAQRIVWRRPACPHFVSCKTCGTPQRLCSGHVRAKTLPGLWPLSLKSRNGRNTWKTRRDVEAGTPKVCKPWKTCIFYPNPRCIQEKFTSVWPMDWRFLYLARRPRQLKHQHSWIPWGLLIPNRSLMQIKNWLQQNLLPNLMPGPHQRVLQFLLQFLLLGWSLFEMASALHHSFPYLHGKSLTMQATQLRNEVAGGSKIWLYCIYIYISRWLMLFGWFSFKYYTT